MRRRRGGGGPEPSWHLSAEFKQPDPRGAAVCHRSHSRGARSGRLTPSRCIPGRSLKTARPDSDQVRTDAGKATAVAVSVSAFSLSVLLVWWFPTFWFTHTDSAQGHFWLAEQTNVV